MSDDQQPRDLSLLDRIKVRRIWHNEEWFYSIIDVVTVLNVAANPRNYWAVLKRRLAAEGGESALDAVEALPLKSADNRMRATDTANRQTLLRIIQSVPSPNAEPVRMWLAEVGEERITEVENPSRALERVRATYRAQGYSDDWIEQRIKTDLARNELTDEWKDRGAQGRDYAILTNTIHNGTFELSIEAHKEYKLLPAKTNLRDHMTQVELALISLGEATATLLHRERDSQGFSQLHHDSREAGEAAGEARQVIEKRIGHSVVSHDNYLPKPKAAQPGLFDAPQEAEPAPTEPNADKTS